MPILSRGKTSPGPKAHLDTVFLHLWKFQRRQERKGHRHHLHLVCVIGVAVAHDEHGWRGDQLGRPGTARLCNCVIVLQRAGTGSPVFLCTEQVVHDAQRSRNAQR